MKKIIFALIFLLVAAGSLSLVCAGDTDTQTIKLPEDTAAFEINDASINEAPTPTVPNDDNYHIKGNCTTDIDEAKSVNIAQSDLDANGAIENGGIAEAKNICLMNQDSKIAACNNSFSALNHLINDNDNPVINLSDDYYFNSTYDADFANGISIKRAVTLNGNGHIIDCKGKARLFDVKTSDVTINDLSVRNAKGNKAAIYFRKSGRLMNCHLRNNKASSSFGGAVEFQGNGEVINCKFNNNAARYGGAISFNRNGKVENCTFTVNHASYLGGAVYFSKSGSEHIVRNCNFEKNLAMESGANGGAIFFDGKGEVKDCYFSNNHAGSNGGAIYFYSNGEVTNCNFTSNFVSNSGGALYFYATGKATNCNFIKNKANPYGGAIVFKLTGSAKNCNFENNAAKRWGAIVSLEKISSAESCIFKTSLDTTYNLQILAPALTVNDSKNITSCAKLTFELKTNSTIAIDNKNKIMQ